jgi:hypothetical protein
MALKTFMLSIIAAVNVPVAQQELTQMIRLLSLE